MPKNLKMIVAIAQNYCIGVNGDLPWKIPADLQWFKKLTTNGTVVMGRKTFESIGKPLPNRRNIVLSRSELDIPNVETIHSLDEIPEEAWVIGGGTLYAQALPLVHDLYVSHVKRTIEGDTYFPHFEQEFEEKETLHDDPDFTLKHYTRK